MAESQKAQSAGPAEDEHRYISERKKRGPQEAKVQPPLTPMIDVTFQLLLYFLLTSTFRPDEGEIPGSLPAQGAVSETETPPLRPIKVILTPRGVERELAQYQIDNLPPIENAEQLFETLAGRQQAVGSDEVPVVIKPYGGVRWKYVVEVFNAAVRARFKNIGFASSG